MPVPLAHQTAPVEESAASATGESGPDSGQSSDQLQPAEPLARLGAIFIDGMIVSVVCAVIATFTLGLSMLVESPGMATMLMLLGNLLAAGYALGYHVVFIGNSGQTTGKRLLGVKVVDVETHEPIGKGRALLRIFVLGLMGAPFYLGYLTVFLDESGRYRGWHDLAAQSRAVGVPRQRLDGTATGSQR